MTVATLTTEQQLQATLRKNPEHFPTLLRFGRLCLSQNRLEQAIEVLQRAHRLRPDSLAALLTLGDACLRHGKAKAALELFRQGLLRHGDQPELLRACAEALESLGEFAQALDYCNRLLDVDPTQARTANAVMAGILEKSHRPDEAYARIQLFLDQETADLPLWDVLGRLALNHARYAGELPRVIDRLETLIAAGRIDGPALESTCFRLGDLYRKLQDYSRSFAWYQRAHATRSTHFDLDALQANLDRLKRAFATPAELPTLDGGATNLFVTGLPRSGTSLIDTLISLNPETVCLGECNHFHLAVCEASSDDQIQWGTRPLTTAALARVRSRYKQKALLQQRPGRFLCDKSLENVFLIGQILQVFPEAKIVWTHRDLRDVCLSCYTSHFAGRHAYCHDLTLLGRYAREIERLHHFWAERYPHNLYTVDYQALATQPEPEIRRLIAFLGFAWDDRYLASEQADYQVRTLSYQQVRQPIHPGAIGKWRHYEQHLEPLLTALAANEQPPPTP